MNNQDKWVFLVEDDGVTRMTAEALLRSLGYQVQTATDGNDALEKLCMDAPADCILSDLVMPNMTGLRLLTLLRKHERFARVPFILASADMDEGLRNQALHAGATGTLKKPYVRDELLAVLKRAMEKST